MPASGCEPYVNATKADIADRWREARYAVQRDVVLLGRDAAITCCGTTRRAARGVHLAGVADRRSTRTPISPEVGDIGLRHGNCSPVFRITKDSTFPPRISSRICPPITSARGCAGHNYIVVELAASELNEDGPCAIITSLPAEALYRRAFRPASERRARS